MTSAIEAIGAKLDLLQTEVDNANARALSAYEKMTETHEQMAVLEKQGTEKDQKIRKLEEQLTKEKEARLSAEKALASVKAELDDLGLG
eukprot:m.112234 g.112234  ORF g.112234 m.112234 type:complete len:89 (-) comp17031_c1_seq15:2800-3066(-)